jgi:hypothetical protein
LLLLSLTLSAQTIPEQSRNPFHSEDQYQLAHLVFDKLSADLSRFQTTRVQTTGVQTTQAQTNGLEDNAIFDRVQAALSVLEQNWDSGHYASRQMEGTISALQMVLRDNRLMPQDRDAFSNDLSRLLEFQTEYY